MKEPSKTQLYTYQEVSKMLKISQRVLAELKATGKIQCVQIGKLVRFSQVQIDNFIKSCS